MTRYRISIRPLTSSDQPLLWDMLYHALFVPPGAAPLPREVVQRPELARYAAGWGREHDRGFAALDATTGQARPARPGSACSAARTGVTAMWTTPRRSCLSRSCRTGAAGGSARRCWAPWCKPHSRPPLSEVRPGDGLAHRPPGTQRGIAVLGLFTLPGLQGYAADQSRKRLDESV